MEAELRALARERERWRERYAEVRADAEARVVEWRWTRGSIVDPDRAYDAERNATRPGRLVRRRPRSGLGIEIGFDASSRPVVERFYHAGDEQPEQEHYRTDSDERVSYLFLRVPWKAPDEQLEDVRVARVTRDGSGRPVRYASVDERGLGWVDRYQYDAAGRVVVIDSLWTSIGDGLHQRLEATHRADGTLDRLELVEPDGRRRPAFVQLDEPIGELLAAIEHELVAAVETLTASQVEPLWALALAYSDDLPLPPTVVCCTQAQRDTWAPGGEQDWWLVNPAEWEGGELPLPRVLEDRCTVASAALAARDQAGKAVPLLHRAAQRLNSGPLLVFAREVAGARERRDLRASLPPDRFAALEDLGALQGGGTI